ncbi:MAG: glycosyl transferase, partial [Candidatus Paceibacterota bacterium]
MKILSISHSDYSGGASRAAYRIHEALRERNVDSLMQVTISRKMDHSVLGAKSRWHSLYGLIRKELTHTGTDLLFDSKYNCSPAILPSGWHSFLNKSDADIIHLHWVNNEMISIADLGKIQKPIVWTLHDMWPFCGAEHYTTSNRW